MIKLLAFIALFLPVFSAAGLALWGRRLSLAGVYGVATGAVALSGGATAALWFGLTPGTASVISFWTWLHVRVGEGVRLSSDFALRLDALALAMMMVVAVISTVVHGYAYGYMKKDPSAVRFACLLNVFTFFMVLLVSAADLGQMFIGWEGVGVASFLLIGFWYTKPAARTAALKAFWINRIGDFFLILGIGGVFTMFGTVNYTDLLAPGAVQIQALSPRFEGVCLLLLVGAMAKSAQFGFHVWLPDAMEGPTPVSALLHSATMVTAGVFLLIRLNPLFEASELVRSVIVGVGVLTALLAGSVALAQTDLKRVIAYSTCSQLGFMFIAIGVSAYGLAFFHLITHAFFKSLLFLGAGIVITKSNHVQDITRMGGMRRQLPITHGVMLLGTLALVGMPLFSGAVSKDLILEAAWAYPGQQGLGALAYYGGLVAVALTALYAWRLMILVFYGPTRTAQDIKTAPREWTDLWKMWLPTLPLAAAALGLGALLKPWFVGEGALWQGVISFGDLALRLERVHQAPWVSLLVSVVVVLSTLTAFTVFWWRALNDRWLHSKMGRVLFAQAFFNERYHKVFVQPILAVGRWLSWSDQAVIDHWGPEGVGRGVKRLSGWICRLQSGYLYRYALWMILGMLGILAIPLIWTMKGGG